MRYDSIDSTVNMRSRSCWLMPRAQLGGRIFGHLGTSS